MSEFLHTPLISCVILCKLFNLFVPQVPISKMVVIKVTTPHWVFGKLGWVNALKVPRTLVLTGVRWNHLEGLLKQSAGPHPRASDSVDLGWSSSIRMPTGSEVMLVGLVWEPHFENHWLRMKPGIQSAPNRC